MGNKRQNFPALRLQILHTPPRDWSATRKREYFAWAAEVVAGCRGVNEWIEAVFDERLSLGKF